MTIAENLTWRKVGITLMREFWTSLFIKSSSIPIIDKPTNEWENDWLARFFQFLNGFQDCMRLSHYHIRQTWHGSMDWRQLWLLLSPQITVYMIQYTNDIIYLGFIKVETMNLRFPSDSHWFTKLLLLVTLWPTS